MIDVTCEVFIYDPQHQIMYKNKDSNPYVNKYRSFKVDEAYRKFVYGLTLSSLFF